MILYNYYVIAFASIILILAILNFIMIKRLRNSIAVISVNQKFLSPEVFNELLNLVLKIRRDLNIAVHKKIVGELKFLVKKDLYMTSQFSTFLESLKRLGYELDTDLYYGSHYLLTIKWDRSRYVQEA